MHCERERTRRVLSLQFDGNLAGMTWFIAHQGGWDEILMFLIPIALAVFLVRRLERRAPTHDDKSDQEDSVSQ